MSVTINAVLDALPAKDFSALKDHLKPIPLEQGQSFGVTGAPIKQIIFPTSGLISVVAELASGERIETALIGRNGVLGGAVVFGGMIHISTSFVQIAGSALGIRVAELIVPA